MPLLALRITPFVPRDHIGFYLTSEGESQFMVNVIGGIFWPLTLVMADWEQCCNRPVKPTMTATMSTLIRAIADQTARR